MQAIIDAWRQGRLEAEPRVVISNNSGSTALQRAKNEAIPAYHLSRKTHPGVGQLDRRITDTLVRHGVNIVVLAGYMRLLGPLTTSRFRGRILNIHPALLPKFGGKGLFGEAVHKAVLSVGERVTGATVHLVDERYDHGPVIAQSKVPVMSNDTVESLGERVLEREHELYVDTLLKIERGEIDLSTFRRGESA